MDPYKGAEQVGPAAEEHEIKVQTQSRIWNCVAYATTLLEENESNKIVLKARGEAISRAVIIAESIKKKTAGLHQNTSIGTNDESEAWKPLEEDLLPSETTSNRSLMTITLSKKELDTSSPGYQSPVADDPMNPLRELDNEGEIDILPSVRAGHDGHGVHDGRWRCEGSITEASYLNVNKGWDARCGYNRGCDAGKGRGRGIYQGFGRGYSGEICSDHGIGNVHQESGNIREASDLSVNRGWDAGRGRGRGRYQAFQGRGSGYSGEIGSDRGVENVHQQSGNISEASGLSVNTGWDAGRGRGRGRYQAFQGHRRGSNGEIGSVHGMETVHQQSGIISEASGLRVNSGWDSGRGPHSGWDSGRGPHSGWDSGRGPHSGWDSGRGPHSGWDSGRGPHSGWDSGRGRGRGRYQAFQGHGRGGYGEIGSDHSMENVHQESGNTSESSDHSVGRGWDSGYGRGRGHERDQAFQGQGGRYSGEIGHEYTENLHQESGGQGVEFAARGRGRGREQASQGRGRWYGVEFAAGSPRENLHQELGNINGVPNLSMNKVWDSRNICAWRGRGLQRDQGFQGRGRGYTGEIGGDYGRQNMHQESVNSNRVPDDNAHRGRDARHGYTGRARGRGRNLALRGRGRAYNSEISDCYGWDNMQQESRGCGELDEQKELATQEPVGQKNVPSQQVLLAIDNLLLDSTRLSFDSLGDDVISHIGSACGFIFSDSGVALVRLLERQRSKLGLT